MILNDEILMRRCLQLASNGLGRTHPNPLVGCVVVRNGNIISEGYHQQHGQYHAERNAILRCKEDLQGATLYVNLEPCSHHGLTPPCADLIVERGISKVVCCNDDPNPQVNGGGFAKLRNAGIEIKKHVLEEEGYFLNRRFFTFMKQQRPYVILKWAATENGFMAPKDKQPYWISNSLAKQLSHRWRTEEAAILVGSQTYLDDHPQLNARLWSGNNPKPIVLDRRNRLNDVPEHWLHLHSQTIPEVLTELYNQKIQSVIVEGGLKILQSFINSGLYDEIRFIEAPTTFTEGLPSPIIPNNYYRSEHQNLTDNTLHYYYYHNK